jgi:Putative zinc-finger
MNCENFAEQLPEYLDGALSETEQAVAEEHIQKCGVCQSMLAQQEAFAKSLRLSFERETQGLSLRPEVKRNILNALKRPEFPPTARENIQAFFAFLWQHPAGAGTVLFCLVLLIFGRRFYQDSANYSSTQGTAKDDRITYVIDVPIQTEMHVYRRQNNMVVDAVVTEISVIDASFSENTRSAPLSNSHIN